MTKAIPSLIKQIIILTSFYGQTYPKTKEVLIEREKDVINQYFYFTQFCLFFTTLTLILSFLENQKIEKFYAFLVPNVIVWNFLVISVYWFLYFFKRDLILSDVMAKPENYSLFQDLCQHLFPLIGLFVCFCEIDMKITYKNQLFNLIVTVIYGTMVEVNKRYRKVYPYAFMNAMGTLKVFIIFIPAVFLIFSGILYLLEYVNKKGKEWIMKD